MHHEEQFCDFFLNLSQWLRRCHLKDFLSGTLAFLLFGGSQTIYAIRTSGSEGDVVQRHCLSRALAAILFSRQNNEIILNLDQWFSRKCCLKAFLIWSSGSPVFQQSVTICAILVEIIMRNNSVKLF